MENGKVGSQLGNYKIVKLLGQGGFAEVYLGEHLYLKSQAAIKLLQARLSSQDDMDSFLKEAQTIARLSHPNIIRVLDFGISEETPYLVMEYAPNGTLRQKHTKNTPLPITTIIPYVKQVADALQHAHDERIIHRDVKPENMLLGRRNEVLLSDFGIALVAQSSRHQGTQDVIGTVAYMSPEQIQGKPRPASDQYSLGIVVYEWLTGERPFHGSFTELCTQHMFAPPPPLQEKIEQISSEVERVLNRALSKDPKSRYESIAEFAQELEQAAQSGPTVKMLPSSSQPSPYATVAMPEDLSGQLPSSPYGTQKQNLTTGSTGSSPNQTTNSSSPSVPFQPSSGSNNPQRSFSTPAQAQNTPAPTPPVQQQPATAQIPPVPTFHSDATVAHSGPVPQPQPTPAQNQGPQKVILPHVPTELHRPQAPHMRGPGQPGGQQPYPQQPVPGQQFQPPAQQAYGSNPQQYYGQPGQVQQPPVQQPPMQAQSFAQQHYVQPQGMPYGQPHQAPPTPQPYQQPHQPAQTPQSAYAGRQTPPVEERPHTPAAPIAPNRSRAEHTPTAESEDFFGIFGEWKWHIIGTIIGLVLFCVLYRFSPTVYGYTIPAVLIVPLFFGGALGPWVGLTVAAGGFFLGRLFYQGAETLTPALLDANLLNERWWLPLLIYCLVGGAAGLSMLRKRRFPTITSALRAALLATIALGICLAVVLYQAQALTIFPGIGLTALICMVIGLILLIVYSIFGRLIDAGSE